MPTDHSNNDVLAEMQSSSSNHLFFLHWKEDGLFPFFPPSLYYVLTHLIRVHFATVIGGFISVQFLWLSSVDQAYRKGLNALDDFSCGEDEKKKKEEERNWGTLETQSVVGGKWDLPMNTSLRWWMISLLNITTGNVGWEVNNKFSQWLPFS